MPSTGGAASAAARRPARSSRRARGIGPFDRRRRAAVEARAAPGAGARGRRLRHLPGRTFVRGFMRNYARLVRLDPDAVLRRLPTANARRRSMRRCCSPRRRRWASCRRRSIRRQRGRAGRFRSRSPRSWRLRRVRIDAPCRRCAHYGRALPPRLGPGARRTRQNGTPLPNPVLAAAPGHGTIDDPRARRRDRSAPACPNRAAPAAEAAIALAFRDTSWTEVRDRDGRVVLSGMNRAARRRAYRDAAARRRDRQRRGCQRHLSRQAGRPRAAHATERRALQVGCHDDRTRGARHERRAARRSAAVGALRGHRARRVRAIRLSQHARADRRADRRCSCAASASAPTSSRRRCTRSRTS